MQAQASFGMNEELMKANNFYKEAQLPSGVSRVLKRSYLEKAIRIYQQQLSNVMTNDSRSSLLRNIGMANLKLGDVVDSSDALVELKLVTFHMKEAIENFTKALAFRGADMTTEWAITVQERILDSFEVAFRRAAGRKDIDSERMRSSHLDLLFEVIPLQEDFDSIRAKCHLGKAQYYYRSSVVSLEGQDFRPAIQFLEYSREETELAKKYGGNNEELSREIDMMEQEILTSRCCCESVRTRCQADQLFHSQVNDSEEVNFEMMWEILDMYQEAVLQTREKDIENEAVAVSRLGRMFDKIFTIREKAHKYYRYAFDLAQTLLPRDLDKFSWFLESKAAVEKFQQEILLEEQRKEEESNAPILRKLKPELDELKAVANECDPYKLLRFLYKKHPPKVKYEFKESKMDKSNIKSYLMKAIMHYHPDRQGEFGIDWKVLCGEITKHLNVRYESFK